jgi:excinuclease ABC subunit A
MAHRDSFIRVRGARVHNLKNINLDIPKQKLVVITGLSGSGKSSLAFDTIYAEAERRFVESLSSYARQFLGVKDKPDADAIDGLSPAISIDQKSVSKNPRSTVGTITEIYDYLRILFARIGKPHCPLCAKPVGRQSADRIVDAIASLPQRKEITILAPLFQGKKGEHRGALEEARRAGFVRVRLDGKTLLLDDALSLPLEKQKKHSAEVVVDRLIADGAPDRARIRDSVETALKIGKGMIFLNVRGEEKEQNDKTRLDKEKQTSGRDLIFSERFACTECSINLPDIEPRLFSFNSPYGACPSCTGLGSLLEVDPELVIPNKRLSIAEGAIRPWASASHRVGRQGWYWWILSDMSERLGFSLRKPVAQLPEHVIRTILYGEARDADGAGETEGGNFEGVIPNLKRRWKDTDSEFTRAEIEKYMIIQTCPECGGKRLRPEALAVKIRDESIASLTAKTVEAAKKFFDDCGVGEKNPLSPREKTIASLLIKEIGERLSFLLDVGLEYLSLDRESTTLAGGEAQRIRLATQIGSRLTGVIYVLDEPSIGLHPRDHARLLSTVKELRDIGNSIIMVEHDAETMRSADWIIDLGPGAGKHGGKVVFEGTPPSLLRSRTLTGEYLSGRKKISFPPSSAKRETKRKNDQIFLTVKGAREHNLKNIEVKIPLGKFVCVSGVSGSGKSTLVNDILAKALLAKIHGAHLVPGKHDEILGIENLTKTVVVDQSPIGRTPRSNPATYTGAFAFVRSVFAKTPEARSRGYTPGRFSFNVKGGRCETCEGQGVKKIEMYFLPDVYVECEVCRGTRYNREALEIEYRGKTIADVLDMTIEESLAFFRQIPQICSRLETVAEVGLGYMKVGQSAPTLSGGEAQRVKLAAELSRRDTGKTLYILDEPTTGLHFDDIRKLLRVLKTLVERGNTVLVIEHNLDVLRNADWIIDLGPEGGEKGGRVIAQGSPRDLMNASHSYTGQWLRKTS